MNSNVQYLQLACILTQNAFASYSKETFRKDPMPRSRSKALSLKNRFFYQIVVERNCKCSDYLIMRQTIDFILDFRLEDVLYPQSTYNINQEIYIWDRSMVLFSIQNLLDKTKGLTESQSLKLKTKSGKKMRALSLVSCLCSTPYTITTIFI